MAAFAPKARCCLLRLAFPLVSNCIFVCLSACALGALVLFCFLLLQPEATRFLPILVLSAIPGVSDFSAGML